VDSVEESGRGRASDRRQGGELVRIRRGGKTALEAALVSKGRALARQWAREEGKKESEGEKERELGEARRMEVVGPTLLDGGDERRSWRRKRRSRWRVGEK